MPAPRLIRIGAPSGDGPLAATPAPAPSPAAPAQGAALPPEVFGVWAEETAPGPPQARPDAGANGRGSGERPEAPAAAVAAAPPAPAPRVRRGPAHQPPVRGGRVSYEDERLNAMRKSGRPVEAVCLDDLRVVGLLTAFDQYALILEVDGVESVVFKHGVIMLRYAQ